MESDGLPPLKVLPHARITSFQFIAILSISGDACVRCEERRIAVPKKLHVPLLPRCKKSRNRFQKRANRVWRNSFSGYRRLRTTVAGRPEKTKTRKKQKTAPNPARMQRRGNRTLLVRLRPTQELVRSKRRERRGSLQRAARTSNQWAWSNVIPFRSFVKGAGRCAILR